MRRTSFVGALAAIAIGAVLAFAVQGTPRWIDLQQAGLIVLLGGAADLIIRTAISDSPLLGQSAADVAAVVEPLGDPVLDAAGNPVNLPPGSPEVLVTAEPSPTPAPAVSHDREVYEQAVRAAVEGGAVDTPESAVTVTTITGRPVRPHDRGARRAAKRYRRRMM